MGTIFLRISEEYWPFIEAVMLTDETHEGKLEKKGNHAGST